ncbi:MAG: hypothetical protein RSB25_16820, partial [Acinetobacter sp.]
TASPTVRAEREQLAQQFVEERLKPQLEQQFQENRGRANEVMGGIANPSGMRGNLSGDFVQQQQSMAQTASDEGLAQAGSTVRKVEENRQNATQQIDNAAQLVAESQQGVVQESAALQQDHQAHSSRFEGAKASELKKQEAWKPDLTDSSKRLEEIKGKLDPRDLLKDK